MNTKTIELINSGIVKQIESGNRLPWIRDWKNAKIKNELPRSRATKRLYTGCNTFLLSSGEFATYQQWQKEGFTPLKNSAEYAVFSALYDPEKKKTLTREEESALTEEQAAKCFPVAMTFRVFSSNRVVDKNNENPFVPENTDKLIIPVSTKEVLLSVQKYSYSSECGINFERQNKAYYRPADHSITLPMPEYFESIDGFFATLFHEMGHSTSKHFKRTGGRFGSKEYAQEELIAELTSAYICAELNIDGTKSLYNHAAYVQSWLAPLQNNLVNFYKAAADAAKAAKYILTTGGYNEQTNN